MNVLVVDVGGSHVKVKASGATGPRRFDSDEQLTPTRLVEQVRAATSDWKYDVVALGYPGAVAANAPSAEPGNLGIGWVGFDYEQAFGKPVRVVNDAVMQALGGYDGGRMLFLGLGTGLGSSLVTEHVVVPLELGCLIHADGETMAEWLGREGLERRGLDAWQRAVGAISSVLKDAFAADYIVLGGGNAERIDPLPPGTRRGGNDDAFEGGFRLWEEFVVPHDEHAEPVWRVVR
jgi:polyphosphate glucokinase